MNNTTVHDCAATGIYIGDSDSHAVIERCNIVRNGGGTRIPSLPTCTPWRTVGDHASYLLQNPTDVIHDQTTNMDIAQYHFLFVPPGHSGMYLEASTAIVCDCLLSKNSLTGLSVVRGGNIKLSSCDIIQNGSEPITIEDAHDLLLGLGEVIRGGIQDLGGNRLDVGSSGHLRIDVDVPIMDKMSIKNRELMRQTRFQSTNYNHVTVRKLECLYL